MALALFRRDREPITEPEVVLPPPPEANPFTEAQGKWSELRQYAERAMDIARQVTAENRQLLADKDSLGREVDRLLAQVVQLQRSNRMLNAYTASVRTRARVVLEAAEALEREATHQAHHAGETQPEPPEETAAEVAPAIERHTPTMPPTNEFPNGH